MKGGLNDDILVSMTKDSQTADTVYPPNPRLIEVQRCWDWNVFLVLGEKLHPLKLRHFPPKPRLFCLGQEHILGFGKKIMHH